MTSTPDPICSDNCGLGDTVPEFIRVWTNVPLPFYAEYNRGKDFQYFGIEPDGRCVWFPINPSTFWNFEKISRYPEGWNFPFTQPIPGKWTWRLSVDRFPFPDLPPIPPPFILNGWQADFDRHIDIDPDHNCTSINTLFDYAHLGFFPPAYIQPLGEESPYPKRRSTQGPCFCSDDCPSGTRPHLKYLITTVADPAFSEYVDGVLYENVFKSVTNCAWAPVDPLGPGFIETLDKRPIEVIGVDNSYIVFLTLQATGGPTELWETIYGWNDDPEDNDRVTAACNQVWHLVGSDPQVPAFGFPVPEYICTTEEARDFVERNTPVPPTLRE